MALCLVVSVALHLVGIVVIGSVAPDVRAIQVLLRPPMPISADERFPIRRFVSKPAEPISERRLAMVRGETGELIIESGIRGHYSGDSTRVPEPAVTLNANETNETSNEPLAVEHGDGLQHAVASFVFAKEYRIAPSMVELDAERRERTVVVIDPTDRRNIKAWVRLPAHPSRSRQVHRIREQLRRTLLIEERRGHAWVDLEIELLEPRQRLSLEDLRRYPVIWTSLLSPVPSAENLATYLKEGGFIVASSFASLEPELRKLAPDGFTHTYLTQEESAFHVFYDVFYVIFRVPLGTQDCDQAILPVDALLVDGRVAAISTYQTYDPGYPVYGSRSLTFDEQHNCLSNRHLANLFLYGLVEPGGMGARYVTRTSAMMVEEGADLLPRR